MAVRTKDELMEILRGRLGEDTSDEALTVIEDFNDTLSDYETRAGSDWEAKYNELDEQWRKRYRDRFYQTPENGETTPQEVIKENADDVKTEGEEKTIEELFTEKENNNGY